MKLLLILAFLGASELCSGAKILFMIPLPSKSHWNLGDPLVRELVAKGHEVTFLSSYKMPNPPKKLVEVIIPDMSDSFNEFVDTKAEGGKFNLRNMSPLTFVTFPFLGAVIMNGTMNSKAVQDMMAKSKHFDVIIGECFLSEGLLGGFSYKYKAPIIGLGTFMPNTWTNEMVGNPAPAAYIPEPILPYTNKMSFTERFVNFFYGLFTQFCYYNNHLPILEKEMKRHFGENLPPLKDLISKTSLVLVNHHYSLAFPRPYLPNMIEVGSYHIKPAKPLPKDLQIFMDEAQNGVIYFSMGSNLQSSEFPQEKFQNIIKALGKLKQRVLWKFEADDSPNLPDNIKISKWMPQSDILAHPNIKLFVTHGGLLSITEAVLRGVPVVAIPVFGDQPMNVRFIEEHEIGVKLDYDDINDVNLLKAINTVLNDPKYARNMKYRSTLLQDVPMSQLDTAIYWIEYVIRYKGAPHLKSAAQDLKWYQLYLLDVYAFLGTVLAAVFYVFYLMIKCCKNCCSKKSTQNELEKKTN